MYYAISTANRVIAKAAQVSDKNSKICITDKTYATCSWRPPSPE